MTFFPPKVNLQKGGIHGAGVETQQSPDGPTCSSPFLPRIALPVISFLLSTSHQRKHDGDTGKKKRRAGIHHPTIQWPRPSTQGESAQLTVSGIHHLNSVSPRWLAVPETEPAPQTSVSSPAASSIHGADVNPATHWQSGFNSDQL